MASACGWAGAARASPISARRVVTLEGCIGIGASASSRGGSVVGRLCGGRHGGAQAPHEYLFPSGEVFGSVFRPAQTANGNPVIAGHEDRCATHPRPWTSRAPSSRGKGQSFDSLWLGHPCFCGRFRRANCCILGRIFACRHLEANPTNLRTTRNKTQLDNIRFPINVRVAFGGFPRNHLKSLCADESERV